MIVPPLVGAVELTDVSETKKTLTVEVPPEVVDTEMSRVTQGYARAARIPGFRPGKAPVQVVRREIPLLGADLRERGVGQVYREVPDGPDLRRYDNAAMPDWPNIPGAYTRLGE